MPQHVILQAEGPECPFGLLFAPCRRVEVRSRAGNAECRGTRRRGVPRGGVACRGASGPLDGAASRWHSARSEAEGTNTHGSLQGHADAPLPGRMSPSSGKFEELDKYKFEEVKARPCCGMGGRVSYVLLTLRQFVQVPLVLYLMEDRSSRRVRSLSLSLRGTGRSRADI